MQRGHGHGHAQPPLPLPSGTTTEEAAAAAAAARFMDEARTIMRAVQAGALESGEEQVQAVRRLAARSVALSHAAN